MILWTVLAATMLIAFSLPMIGQRVLERRIVFVDLALAQVAATGYALGMAIDISSTYTAAGMTAFTALMLATISEDSLLPKEAVMGAVYASASALGIVMLSVLPHGEGQLMELLFGSILGLDWEAIGVLGIFAIVGMALAFPEHSNTYLDRLRFYTGLSLIIVPAIHALGIMLVFSFLVMPAICVWRHGHNGPGWQAIALALGASLIGVVLSDFLNLPPSATVVLVLSLFSIVFGTIIHFVVPKPEEAVSESEAGTKNQRRNNMDDE